MTRRSPNQPSQGEVFLDHVGHFVPDADTCAEALRSVGFTVTPFSAQVAPDPATGRPALTGTGNVCVMLRHGYLEFLAHTADTPIGLEFKEALARRAGLHLAAFAVADAEMAHARLSAAGFRMRALVRMSRQIATETGAADLRFTVARLAKGTMPEGRIQLLTHESADALWQKRWLDHPNGAKSLRSMIISAPDPDEAAERFAAFLGRPAVTTSDCRRQVALDRGTVEVLPEPAAADLLGTSVEPGRSIIAGYRVAVSDLARTLEFMTRAGLRVGTSEGRAVVPFPDAIGAGAWVFEPE